MAFFHSQGDQSVTFFYCGEKSSEMVMNKHHVAVACVVGAALVAMTGNDGWGWLLFVAFLLS